eukprot:1161500-Pelagomonas_calceolata.AAC.6
MATHGLKMASNIATPSIQQGCMAASSSAWWHKVCNMAAWPHGLPHGDAQPLSWQRMAFNLTHINTTTSTSPSKIQLHQHNQRTLMLMFWKSGCLIGRGTMGLAVCGP